MSRVCDKTWKVFVTRIIPVEGLKILRQAEDVEIEINPGTPLPNDELLEKVRDVNGILCTVFDRINEELMEAASKLSVIANFGIGYDIDVKAATRRGIIITNTPYQWTDTETVADHTWALLFTAARRVLEADRFVRDGRFKGWEPILFLGANIHEKTLGVVGAGRIGSAVARRAVGFRMRILYTDLKRNEEVERDVGAKFVDLETLLKESDFVTIHATPLIHHLIGRRELLLMKPTAYLINTARGVLIDEEALVEALREKRISGAAIDVYEDEPNLASGLMELDNVVLTPHIASATREARAKLAICSVENLLAALRGEKPPNIVNPEVLEE